MSSSCATSLLLPGLPLSPLFLPLSRSKRALSLSLAPTPLRRSRLLPLRPPAFLSVECHAHPVSALAKPRMGPTSRSVHSLTALRSSGLLCRFSPPSSPSFEQPRTSPSVIEERRGKANAAGPLWHSLIRFARPTRPLCCSCFGQESSNACPLVCKRA